MFPDYHVSKIQRFDQEQRVCLEAEDSGAMKGQTKEPGGQIVQPTNKHFKIQSSIVCKTTEERLATPTIYYDVLCLM